MCECSESISVVERFTANAFRIRIPKSENEVCSMCGPHFCSMKIPEDVRKFAAEQELSENEALQAGMEQKTREFSESGSEIYSKARDW